MITFIWVVAVLAVGLWSLCAWGLHTLMSMDPGWIRDLGPLMDRIPYGTELDRWMPGWREMLQGTTELATTVLGWVGGSAPWIAWALWGVGTAALVVTAALLTLVVVLLRHPRRPAPAPWMHPD